MPSPNQPPLLGLDQVSRRFGTRTVVDQVTLSVRPGEFHLLVGPNGSGKSTIARLAVGLLRPHRGTARVSGADPRTSEATRRLIGYLGHESQLYADLTPVENLQFAARLHGMTNVDLAVSAILDRLEVAGERETPVRRLSRGYVQRVALCRSLIHGPRLLVWDEPLTGLDQASLDRAVRLVESVVTDGVAVLLVSHDLAELWRLSGQVHVVEQGKIRLSTSTATPLGEFQRQSSEVRQ